MAKMTKAQLDYATSRVHQLMNDKMQKAMKAFIYPEVVRAIVEQKLDWLREHNLTLPPDVKIEDRWVENMMSDFNYEVPERAAYRKQVEAINAACAATEKAFNAERARLLDALILGDAQDALKLINELEQG